MGVNSTQRNATNNQSTVDFERKNLFLCGNRYSEGVYKNTTGSDVTFESGFLVARAAGTYEEATVVFSATSITAGQTVILGGLTYTSTAVTTQAQLAVAFANLDSGATTGAGTATGTYGGALTGFSTGAVVNGTTVVFTATATGNTTNLAQTGTGAAAAITIVAGVTTIANGLIPVTSSNLADIIGISKLESSVVLNPSDTQAINYCLKGDIDSSLLTLPSGVTLETVVGAKILKDVLTDLGFVLFNVTELSKFDN
jgi:hypothetical protein